MESVGISTISALVGDFVAYRSLRPCDARLGAFAVPPVPPRKIDRAYGAIVGNLLMQARHVERPDADLRRLILVGDNAQTDGAAFENLCAVMGWDGSVVLVQERPAMRDTPPAFATPAPVVNLAHWDHLRRWASSPAAPSVDHRTVILLDVDKTLLGARGRNDRVIDEARGIAMRHAIAAMLGAGFDATTFEDARRTFNDQRFHGLTGDNQDYVGLLCLVAGSGVWTTAELADAITSGRIATVDELADAIAAADSPHAERLRAVAAPVLASIAERDPTPFKAFRVREYYETVARMGLNDGRSIADRLDRELVLTAEVFAVARRWHDAGALLFALSDKPDEAAIPPADDPDALPLHHVPTHMVSSTSAS